MARDRLLPRWFATVHPRFGTPYRITIATGVLVTVMAGVIPLGQLTELVNIGTLAAFLLVSIGVIVLRRTRPDLPRTFRVPLMPVLPIVSALACLWLMLNLTGGTWVRFLIWMALGFAIYFAYGRSRSRFTTPGDREDAAAANAARKG
jgi:APA family basic amino acid/polyamine antiporter